MLEYKPFESFHLNQKQNQKVHISHYYIFTALVLPLYALHLFNMQFMLLLLHRAVLQWKYYFIENYIDFLLILPSSL